MIYHEFLRKRGLLYKLTSRCGAAPGEEGFLSSFVMPIDIVA
jgi:hypothetical protein